MSDSHSSSALIDWEALQEFAVAEKRRESQSENVGVTRGLSAAFREGGLHIVRRVDFSDGDRWIVRVQKMEPSIASCQRLLHEVCAVAAIQQRSSVPIPKIITYRTAENSPVRAGFIIQQYVHADTAMNVLGEQFSRAAQMTAGWKEKYFAAMATIQAEMSSVRFPMIGCIIRTSNGYSVGPIPGIGGPFETSADFFTRWAKGAVLPLSRRGVKQRTPPEQFEQVWDSLTRFPSQVAKLAESYSFRKGPFPVIHGDLFRSNVLMDDDCNVKAIIDWEDAMVGPWELVEFIKDLRVVPAAMNGPLYEEPLSARQRRIERENYVRYVAEVEVRHSLDNTLSMILRNSTVQDFAHTFWYWQEGKAGYYTEITIFQ